MSIATVNNLEKTYGQRTLFDKLSLTIYPGERIGLIGANGSGKTTLFKALAGEFTGDAGTATVGDGIKLGYLRQDHSFEPSNTVLDEAELAFGKLHDLAHQLRDLEHAMAEHTGDVLEKTLEKYTHVQHDFDLAGGYVWHHKLEATLLGVGLGRETWEQNVETLSGGQRSRLALAKILIAEPDLLLLDEPTNHLDLAAIEWLENYLLNDFNGAFLLISHDRYLLDKLVTRIVWLTRGKLQSYPGNYSSFVAQRELQELSQERAFEQQQADIDKQKEFVRRFGAGQRSKEAKGREKRLERLLKSDQMIDRVETQKQIHLSIQTDQRAGDRVLDVRELSKSFGPEKVLWKNLKFEVKRGERIGVIGPNGSGKTTLLRALLGQEDADGGNIRWGANLNIGYYDQRLDDTLNPENTVIEELGDGREGQVSPQQLRDTAATMLFRGDDIYKPISLLSGGERARVRLAEMILDKPNVLVLDEPTNHLDIASAEALEGTIRGFSGTVLVVSHDRYFLDKVATRLLVLDPPGMIDFEGTYSEWQRKQRSAVAVAQPVAKPQAAKKASSKSSAKPSSAAQSSKKSSRSDNPYLRPFGMLSMKDLEQQIADTEIAIGAHQQTLADPETFKDTRQAKTVQADYDALTKKLEQLEAEYFARET